MPKRSAILPYVPSNPPAGMDRAVWDEFYKLQQALIDLDRPVALAINSSEYIAVTPTLTYDRLFDENVFYEYQLPLGMFDTTTGIFTAQQEGLYTVDIVIEIPAFPNPGSRNYTATLRTTKSPANGDPDIELISTAGGPDEAPLRFSASILRPLNSGDRVWFDLDLTEETFTGNLTVRSFMHIVRIGSYK